MVLKADDYDIATGGLTSEQLATNFWPHLPHYYGDFVRQLMLGIATLVLFAAPFYADSLKFEFPFEVAGAVVLVGLAAATNPLKKNILTLDAIAAGVVMIVYQMWALYGYEGSGAVAFVLREVISIIAMFAFYFSVKTVRAMLLHQIWNDNKSVQANGAAQPKSKDNE